MRGTRGNKRGWGFYSRFIPARAGNANHFATEFNKRSVHPRACGEREFIADRPGLDLGSSPRVRGTRHQIHRRCHDRRFIPARAGNAATLRPTAFPSAVHPRACGERDQTTIINARPSGSSPRVRGTLQKKEASRGNGGSSPRVRGTPSAGAIRTVVQRFIPARAGNASLCRRALRGSAVHPRACGERVSACHCRTCRRGSSPRVRGTQVHPGRSRCRTRFIPARAGNADACRPGQLHLAVHPRACGERGLLIVIVILWNGSSPRVRGTRNPRQRIDRRARFIPARAGNANTAIQTTFYPPVHPRACGERFQDAIEHIEMNGSSPRVRGTPGVRICNGEFRRFIPARAGNAPTSTTATTSAPVHPRACGEREERSSASHRFYGSSPRVRGTLVRSYWYEGGERFIPARAGNARGHRERSTSSLVHPRACGERTSCACTEMPAAGSSPRVRGTRAQYRFDHAARRFIPARAGNAKALVPRCRSVAVHPRACGERHPALDRNPHDYGSSPRVRGTQSSRPCRRALSRFIPARAGNAAQR